MAAPRDRSTKIVRCLRKGILLMKKIIPVVIAVILPIVMLSGCSSPLTKPEYKKQVIKLVDEYLYYALGSEEMAEAMEEQFGYMDLSDFDTDVLDDVKKVIERQFEKADNCLDQLEKLKPPESMEDFHDDLLSCIDKARTVEERMLAIYNAKNEEKFEAALEKARSATESLMNKIQRLVEDEDWLVEGIMDEDSKFMETSTMVNSQTKAKVTSADATASTIVTAINTCIADLYTHGISSGGNRIIYISVRNGNLDLTADPAFPETSGGINMHEWFVEALNESYRFNNAAVIAVIQQGKCVFAEYTESTTDPNALYDQAPLFDKYSGTINRYFDWNGKTAGITSGGYIVGTSPKVNMY